MLVLVSVLFELENEWDLFEGIIEEIVRVHVNTGILSKSPVEEVAIEESDILPFNQESLPLVFLLADVTILDAFFVEVVGEFLVLGGDN